MNTLSIIFTALSVLFSGYTLYRQRKHLTVDFDTNCYLLDPKTQIEDAYNFCQNVKSSKAIYLQITIVNPSFVNMAYLDLRAFNPVTNANHFVATARSIPELMDHRNLFLKPFGDDALEKFFIEIPECKHGSLPAGSCVTLDVLVFINDQVDTSQGIVIDFKSTKKTWFHRSPWSDTNRKCYTHYSRVYQLNKS